MDYESSDILGSNSSHVRNPGAAKWFGFSKTACFLALLLAAYVVSVHAWEALLKWREKSYRLSMRRRHGIPDNDHRPFNVAYAAVLRARHEEEVANNRVHRVDVDQLYDDTNQHAAPPESNIRQRKGQNCGPEPAWPNGPINGLPGRFNPLAANSMFIPSSNGLPSPSSHSLNFADRYNPNPAPAPPVVRFADEIEDAGLPRRGSLHNLNSPQKHQKRAHEEDDVDLDVPENPKKTRVEGDEFIDGDEDAEWLPRQKRGEKRVLREDDLDGEEDNAGPRGRRIRGKKARKVSLEKSDVLMTSDDNADDMDVDEDAPRDVRQVVRGKKRDAGSSFGGDEAEEAESVEQAQKSRSRKRQTVGKRKSDAAALAPSRGQKRDRDLDEDGSDIELAVPGTPTRSSRKTKKRGKKSKVVQEDDEERSMDESSASKGKGRPIGDQWESNGVLYRIGPNGQRMRQALVKKAARKFTMPMDSQHPDKNANLEVCIETWLTEEEYKDYKSRHLLAWQDSPKGTQEPASVPLTPVATEPPSTPTPNPAAKGKNLLWDSPASPFPVFAPSPAEKAQVRPKAHFRQSIAADLGVRVNPFEKVNALHVGGDELAKNGIRANGRRVVVVREMTNSGLPGLADTTNNLAVAQAPLARRTFSKWEKQDLEAKAMMKMREANQAKVKEKELKEKLEKEKKDREAATTAAASIPTISLTKPVEVAAKPPTISFAPPVAGSSASTQPPSFSLAPMSVAAAPPKLSFAPPAAAGKPQQSSSNLFSQPASGGAASTPVSNPFAKPPVSLGAAPTPASNPFASPQSTAGTAAPPASTSNQTATPSFSFSSTTQSGNKPATGFAPPADRPVAGAPTRKPTQFSFPANPAPANAPAGASSGTPSFSFAAPTQNATSAAGAEQNKQGQSGSLLSRMGGTAKPAETAPPAPSAFSFKPTDQSEKPASAFAPQQATPKDTPAAAATPPAPKFNFSFAPKPVSTSPATPASSSSLTGALGASDSNPTFSFAAPKAADKATTTPAGTPTFSFGTSASAASTSAFASPTPVPVAGANEQKEQPKPVFSNFGGAATPSAFGGGVGSGAATPSAFGGGAGSDTSKPSAFGSGAGSGASVFGGAGSGVATPSAFGGGAGSGAATPSVFGGGGGAGSAAVSSVFGGGASSGTGGTTSTFGGAQSAFGGFGTSAAKPAEETAKPTPVFGSTPAPNPGTSTSTPATQAPAFSFAFGNNNATTPSATTAAPANPFAAKPSAFGGPSLFGSKPATASETAATSTPQGSPFGGGGSSIFSGGKPATGSVFGGSAVATPSIFGAPSALGVKSDATTTPAPSPFGVPPAPSAFGGAAAAGPKTMLSNDTITQPRPRPPARIRRSTSQSLAQGASPPPPYASATALLLDNGRKPTIPNYLGSPMPATLQMVGLDPEQTSSRDEDDNPDWLSEKSREELAQLLLKADDIIKERETELGVTSAVCKSLYENNVTLKNKHDALVARIPQHPITPHHNRIRMSPDSSFDSTSSPPIYPKSRTRKISVSPGDISLLSDQNAELLQKLENLEAESSNADRSGRRALRRLEREIQLLRDELEKTQARSEQLEKTAQAGTEKIVEQIWRKKKEREAKFRAMRHNTSGAEYSAESGDDSEIRDFAPAGFFSKNSLSPSKHSQFPSSSSSLQFPTGLTQSPSGDGADLSYGGESAFVHPQHQYALVSQLLSKIQELEETNARIIQQQSETADKLHAVQLETESISKVYECFSADNGVEWELVADDVSPEDKSAVEGTIRFRSFRRSLEGQDESSAGVSSMLMPHKTRKSVMNLFNASNEAGPPKLSSPRHDTLSSTMELSPLRFDTSQSQSQLGDVPFHTLQSELGDELLGEGADPFLRPSSLYSLSFTMSPSPSPKAVGRSLRDRHFDSMASRDHSMLANSALQLSVEPPSPVTNEDSSLLGKHKARYRRMSQTLFLRTSRWVDGRLPNESLSQAAVESTPKREPISSISGLPQRLTSTLDLVMENFTGPAHGADEDVPTQSPSQTEVKVDDAVVLDGSGKKQTVMAIMLEVWLWLQFAIIILVFLWAMAKRGPKSVLGEADKRAVVRRR
ncbi:hypothetical protein B0H10DRAFT_2219643 [Mycena sp. CBHHK59/15]|nr:hypothetical protein B0H10DRAFT_2219643 [Mycena sp. CBHHK59/15]